MKSQTVTEVIRQATGKKVEDVLFGITIVPEFSDKIEITIMANNFKDEMELIMKHSLKWNQLRQLNL